MSDELDPKETIDMQVKLLQLEMAQHHKTAAKYAELKAQIEAEESVEAKRANLASMLEAHRVRAQVGRPSNFLDTWFDYDEERKQFSCAYDGLIVYGHSPEAAADNFDHMWRDGRGYGTPG